MIETTPILSANGINSERHVLVPKLRPVWKTGNHSTPPSKHRADTTSINDRSRREDRIAWLLTLFLIALLFVSACSLICRGCYALLAEVHTWNFGQVLNSTAGTGFQ